MPCKLCGDTCRCSSDASPNASLDANPAAAPRWLADSDFIPSAAMPQAESETPPAEMSVPLPSPEASIPTGNAPEDLAPEDPPAWRQEIAARLNRYQTRRKPRPPRYPSLQLRFDAENP